MSLYFYVKLNKILNVITCTDCVRIKYNLRQTFFPSYTEVLGEMTIQNRKNHYPLKSIRVVTEKLVW